MQVGETRLLFSGDLGPDHKAFHADPEGPAGLDHVICESTYGDRAREDLTIEQRRTLLEAEIKAALTRSEEHTSELQSLIRISYAVLRLKKKNTLQSIK